MALENRSSLAHELAPPRVRRRYIGTPPCGSLFHSVASPGCKTESKERHLLLQARLPGHTSKCKLQDLQAQEKRRPCNVGIVGDWKSLKLSNFFLDESSTSTFDPSEDLQQIEPFSCCLGLTSAPGTLSPSESKLSTRPQISRLSILSSVSSTLARSSPSHQHVSNCYCNAAQPGWRRSWQDARSTGTSPRSQLRHYRPPPSSSTSSSRP